MSVSGLGCVLRGPSLCTRALSRLAARGTFGLIPRSPLIDDTNRRRHSTRVMTIAADLPGADTLHVSSSFDGGNIEVVWTGELAHVAKLVQLQIRPDPFCASDSASHFQWFYFRVSNMQTGEPICFEISNAGESSYPDGFKGYNVCASYDGVDWVRVPSRFEEKDSKFQWRFVPEHGAVYFAYFAPYSLHRHGNVIAEMQSKHNVSLTVLGKTLDGRDIDCLRIGHSNEEGMVRKRKVWIIARQHPGETMAEWAAEGLLRRLTDEHDPISKKILQQSTFYVVPNMNPDGSARGHLRTNACAANLNREWADPSLERSPEVFHVLNAMDAVGVDLLIDIHGDEALPYNFFVSNSAIPGWTPRLEKLENALSTAFLAASPDFQTEHGYPRMPPGKADLRTGSKQVGQRFDCLAVTLEQPFKDTADSPDPIRGWSPERSMRLGAALLNAILAVIPDLR